jgi:hypothetical protein
MQNNKKIVIGLIFTVLFVSIVPAAKAEAFGFGDIQSRIILIPQGIVQWFQGLGQFFNFHNKEANNKIGNQQEANPEPVSPNNATGTPKAGNPDFKPELRQLPGVRMKTKSLIRKARNAAPDSRRLKW